MANALGFEHSVGLDCTLGHKKNDFSNLVYSFDKNHEPSIESNCTQGPLVYNGVQHNCTQGPLGPCVEWWFLFSYRS